MTPTKIAIIAESIDVNDSSCTKCNVALIVNLKECGFDLMVYHYTRKKIALKNIDCRPIKEIKFSLNYLLSRTQRKLHSYFNIYLHTFFESVFGFSFTFFNDVNSIKLIIKEVKDYNPDYILTLSKGTSFRPHYALLSFPELHEKWIANIHDPFPAHLSPRPFTWVEPGYNKKEKFFKELSEKAKYSSFPSQLLKEWMGSYFPNFLKTGVIIPHQNAEYEFENTALPSYLDVSKFNLLHAGNLLQQRSPVGLIEGFRLFLNQNPEARTDSKLILLGPAPFHSQILEEYKRNNPELYIHIGNVSFDVVYHLQKNVSINIILESKSEISPFLPGKFPHCVEANKTILSLAPYYSETKRLLGDQYPYWSEADDKNKIAHIIEKAYQLWKQNPDHLLLNRGDLQEYLSVSYLKKVIDDLVIKS
ncbi:glycosyltransferase family protein [Flavobacterium psychrotolerans]|uniref:UDP-glycosyltransferase n=1 Tax=Flavobacterium psychrotolerans TaxID=2169410 RepID=A0A2U1JGP3_9FLAO|nr:glycosyltransferase family 1 protein [Flavobacterium psychrotolerans]PWA04043.1 UDP-glycosyltransferase [Flavobacterium psychrotolerans]